VGDPSFHRDCVVLLTHVLRAADDPHTVLLRHFGGNGGRYDEDSGAGLPPLTESDILGPSEAFRGNMDYFSYSRNSRAMLERLAATEPATLACMYGSAWRGDGAALLRALADSLSS